MTEETSATRPVRRLSPDWMIVVGVLAIFVQGVWQGYNAGNERAEIRAELREIRTDLHRIELDFGQRLARIEQALFGPPPKTTPKDGE